jgi:hypothetical protein
MDEKKSDGDGARPLDLRSRQHVMSS